MEQQEATLQDYLAIISRRKVPSLITIMAVFSIGVLVAVVWPPTYRSTATILIKEQEIPEELVRSTVTSFAVQRIETIKQRVLTRANLMQIIEKYNLYVSDRKKYTNEEILETMREDIGLNMINAEVMDPRTGRPGVATIAFTLSFESEGQNSAQKVAGELTSLFLAENLKERKEKASETLIFLTEETEKLSVIIADFEKKLAAFKNENPDSLPEMSSMNFSMLDRAERDLVQVDAEIRSREERKFYLESQLAQINPLTNMRSSTGQTILDPVSRLKSLESEYASISAKYSEHHPDVIKIKREIEGLRQQTGGVESTTEKAKEITTLRTQLASLSKKYASDHPDVKKLEKTIAALEKELAVTKKYPEKKVMDADPENPAYISVLSQLNTVESDLKSFTKRKAELQKRMEDFEGRLAKAPQVERNYSILKRDLENALLRHSDIKARQMQAEIGEALEKESKGESFVLIDPAQFPEEPVKPNRMVIVFLAFIISIGCGLGVAILQEALDASVRGVRGVTKLLTAAPLAVIPVIYNAQDYVRNKRLNRLMLGSVLGCIVVLFLLVHFFFTPLDVLWFKSIRKAEIVIGV